MKLALVTHFLSDAGGGIKSVVEPLSSRLDQRTRETRVFGIEDPDFIANSTRWVGAATSVFKPIWPRSLGIVPSLAGGLHAFDPDLVHSHGMWMWTSGSVARWGSEKRPYVVSPHGMLEPKALEISRMKKRIAQLLFETRHLSNATCMHALNLEEAKAIREFGVSRPIAVIPNGVDLPSAAEDGIGPAPWNNEFPNGAKVMLFLGRLHPKKNVEGLIKAWAQLQTERSLSDWHLAIAGWGENGHDRFLMELATELALNDRIAFLGHVHGPKKDAVLRHADAFVLPSHSEGLPMAILEAWAHGKPVAKTRACNLPEGFQLNAAFEIEADPAGLASGLAEFLSANTQELVSMGQAGRQLVEQKFSWDKVADSFIEVYNWTLNGGSPPSCVLMD